jgi:GDPmannose 4,6-dehydratase
VETLLGDPTKAKTKLGWQLKTSFAELVREMVAEDLSLARRDALVSGAGYRTYGHSE